MGCGKSGSLSLSYYIIFIRTLPLTGDWFLHLIWWSIYFFLWCYPVHEALSSATPPCVLSGSMLLDQSIRMYQLDLALPPLGGSLRSPHSVPLPRKVLPSRSVTWATAFSSFFGYVAKPYFQISLVLVAVLC